MDGINEARGRLRMTDVAKIARGRQWSRSRRWPATMPLSRKFNVPPLFHENK